MGPDWGFVVVAAGQSFRPLGKVVVAQHDFSAREDSLVGVGRACLGAAARASVRVGLGCFAVAGSLTVFSGSAYSLNRLRECCVDQLITFGMGPSPHYSGLAEAGWTLGKFFPARQERIEPHFTEFKRLPSL